MSEARPPAVLLPTVIASQRLDEEELGEETVRVELPLSNKFGFAWPTDPPPPVPLPLASDRPPGVSLSSSEGETDISEEELSRPSRLDAEPGESDGFEFVTPTNHLDSDQNPLEQPEPVPTLPRLSRAFSMPLPSQLGSLQNPRRVPSSPSSTDSPAAIELSPEIGHFQELSLELADSVQMVIQTLLQLSPPQLLDPAKEQFSACSLSIPTPSISAMFTSMKNLNYMSANMPALSIDLPLQHSTAIEGRPSPSITFSDFDIGEMLQSVGDALSGIAAQAGVDLVLFHGDLGMKHVAVKGDESGISYTLSHIIRQIFSVTRTGDTVEIGLFIEATQEHASQDRHEAPGTNLSGMSSPTHDSDGPLRCTFHIVHKFSSRDAADGTDVGTSESSGDPTSPVTSFRPEPMFKTLFLRRLLRHIGASFEDGVESKGLSVGRSCEFVVTLDRGSPSVVNPTVNAALDDPAYLGYPDFKISNEPTLEELVQFAETLKGKKVTLFADSKGSFAQHLTSYLTDWGLDVSHVSTEPGADAQSEYSEGSPDTASSSSTGREEGLSSAFQEQASGMPSSTAGAPVGSDASPFYLIDDNVAVLRARLQKIKAQQAYPLHLNTKKRPSLATNHRPRSSPQVARVMGFTPATYTPFASPPVIVHFTSLANFKLVKDAIQSVFVSGAGSSSRLPEVIVIPKPAGPRRVLTALHTAITRPIVDPFFYPTATSPISPGFHAMPPFFNMPGAAKSPGGRSTTSIRTASDRSARSPKEYPPSSPRGAPDSMEYFSDAAARLGASPSSGLVIQSPDGQPAGIFFHPKPKGSRSNLPTPQADRAIAQFDYPGRPRGVSFRRTPDQETKGGLAVGFAESPRRSPRPSAGTSADVTAESQTNEGTQSKGKARHTPAADRPAAPPPSESHVAVGAVSSPAEEHTASSTLTRAGSRKNAHPELLKGQSSDQPTSPVRTNAPASTRRPRWSNHDNTTSSHSIFGKKGKPSDTTIVPPISVLIVDDNPINQTILSTFMTKKKIKYDVAKNGEEAVMKWQTGGFHLILMDIQMPVMDGIEATKEIRRMEKVNAMGGFPSTPQSEGQRTPSDVSTSESRASTVTTPPYRSSVIIVALTASSLQSDRVAALAAGCNDFLTKPVSLHWLNSKIIEWGSIKALQMWADIRPDVVKSISSGQAAQAQNVARRLHVPEGRSTPPDSGSRSSSVSRRNTAGEGAAVVVKSLLAGEKPITPNSVYDYSPAASSGSSSGSTPLAAAQVVAEHILHPAAPVAPIDSNAPERPGGAPAEVTQSAPDAERLDGDNFFPTTPASDPVESSQKVPLSVPDSSGRPGTPPQVEKSETKDAAPATDESTTESQDDSQPPPPPPPEPQ